MERYRLAPEPTGNAKGAKEVRIPPYPTQLMEDEMFEKEILDLFKVMVTGRQTPGIMNYDYVSDGFVLDFKPTTNDLQILREAYKPLDINVLFTVQERKTLDPFELISKQLLHYIEVYGLNSPGLFNLEVADGKVVTLTYVHGVTTSELEELIQNLLYTNAPVKDAEILRNIINHYRFTFDINQVKNNELRVLLYDINQVYTSGDDAVRYICYQATTNPLLIKSPETIQAVKEYAPFAEVKFLADHAEVLAQVFNRHKKLILALKNDKTRNVINKISRLSKSKHVPIKEAINKRFVSEALNDNVVYSVLNRISLRDKFKYLNLLEYKKEGLSQDAFVIRNGKVHLEEGRIVYTKSNVERVISHVLGSLSTDLKDLKDKNILLDPNVHYGLPISRKQTIGNLPFGTTVSVEGETISSGIYWHNNDGARDLDLSAIDAEGNRTGWGQYSGYDRNPITFSGDVTDARYGAMEFMTSNQNLNESYGLFVNIFNGKIGSKMSLVVGNATDDHWIENPILLEEHVLDSRGNVIGFVKNGKFVVYTCRLNDRRVSKNEAIISRGLSNFWTINKLFDTLQIKYDVDKDPKKVYDYDLTYKGFTFDKLERVFTELMK